MALARTMKDLRVLRKHYVEIGADLTTRMSILSFSMMRKVSLEWRR